MILKNDDVMVLTQVTCKALAGSTIYQVTTDDGIDYTMSLWSNLNDWHTYHNHIVDTYARKGISVHTVYTVSKMYIRKDGKIGSVKEIIKGVTA